MPKASRSKTRRYTSASNAFPPVAGLRGTEWLRDRSNVDGGSVVPCCHVLTGAPGAAGDTGGRFQTRQIED